MTFSSSFAELMHYFGLHFTIYYAAALVPLAAVLRLLLHRRVRRTVSGYGRRPVGAE